MISYGPYSAGFTTARQDSGHISRIRKIILSSSVHLYPYLTVPDSMVMAPEGGHNVNHAKTDKRSFVLGMITAFCECVAGGCKQLALSPPLTHEDYEAFSAEACEIIERHGLVHAHEKNPEQPETDRREWILIARRPQTLEAYRRLREKYPSPAVSLEPYEELLSYNPQESIHTGYDAYRSLFPD